MRTTSVSRGAVSGSRSLSFSVCVGWFMAAILAAGCATTPRTNYYEAQLESETQKLKTKATELSSGDVFEVRVYNEKALSGVFRISPEGTIDFPLINRVEVAGLTPNGVADRISERLQDGFLRAPNVTVYVKEFNSKKIFVIGQVRNPGTFVFQDGMNVVQAVTLAGGFTKMAAKDDTVVTRKVEDRETRIAVPVESISAGRAPNFDLIPGDIIFIPEGIL